MVIKITLSNFNSAIILLKIQNVSKGRKDRALKIQGPLSSRKNREKNHQAWAFEKAVPLLIILNGVLSPNICDLSKLKASVSKFWKQSWLLLRLIKIKRLAEDPPFNIYKLLSHNLRTTRGPNIVFPQGCNAN